MCNHCRDMMHARSTPRSPSSSSQRGRRVSVLLVTDPGLASRRVRGALPEIEAAIRDLFEHEVAVHWQTQLVRMGADYLLDVESARAIADHYDDVRATVVLTEVPRHTGGSPLVAEVFTEPKVGLISLPALGFVTRERLIKAIVSCLVRLEPAPRFDESKVRRRNWGTWTQKDGTADWVRHASGLFGVARLTVGMVITNEPWRTAPRLSSALAAATAAGAFGIFYNSIWQMAGALSPARLVLIALLTICSMVAWLMLRNRLWDKPARESLSAVIALYNASTVITLFVCVLAMYAVLAIAIFLATLVVIDPGYMTQVLGAEATIVNYLDIAWLSAAMGTAAGALGSSFDSETDVRKITHGQRERLRLPEADDD